VSYNSLGFKNMSNQEKFKVGDIVKLKSGGPDMTINKVRINHDTGEESGFYDCQ